MAMMNLDLTGKTALVTASVTGIGLAVAQQLCARGARVWINGRKPDRIAAAVRAIQDRVPGAEVMTVLADIATAEGCQTVINTVTDPDILINMAGGTEDLRPFADLPDASWQYTWDFNVMSGVRLSRHYVPILHAKDFGRIIFVSSNAGLVTPPEIVDYGVCKAAVMRLSRCVAEIFHRHPGVTVNCVAPGPTMADWVHREAARNSMTLAEFQERHFTTNEATSLLGGFAETDEVANLITYLCCPASNATRGAVLRVEGGATRSD